MAHTHIPTKQKVFLSSFPKLIEEWDYSVNEGLNPKTITKGSKVKVGWICAKNPEHKWFARIDSRAGKQLSGCPYCSGRLLTTQNNLQALYPEIASQWHPSKNLGLSKSQIAPHSNKRVWWVCGQDKNHEWEAKPDDRVRGQGCPFCSGNAPSISNNLGLDIELSSQWHPNNLPLMPKDCTLKSGRKVWWKCPKGSDHEWQTTINSRSGSGSGCPFCAGVKASKKHNLKIFHPALADEWHIEKNSDKTPEDFTPFSNKKVWWICPKFPEHQWQATIYSRSNGNGCPHCAPQTSAPEIRILTELRVIFPDAKARTKIAGKEADVLIDALKLVVEYDGDYYHKVKKEGDLSKNSHFKQLGYDCLRIRGGRLQKLTGTDILTKSDTITKGHMDGIYRWILDKFDNAPNNEIHRYLSKTDFQNDSEYRLYLSYFPKPFPEHSLLAHDPIIAAQWDYDRNFPLRPENVSRGTRIRVWWICEDNSEHKWKVMVKNRTQPAKRTGCPFCRKRKVLK